MVSPLQLLRRLLARKFDMRTKLGSGLRSHSPSGIVITFYHLVYTAFQCISIFTPAPHKFPYRLALICLSFTLLYVQGGSNMTGTDLCVNKPHCAAAVRLVYTQISPGHI